MISKSSNQVLTGVGGCLEPLPGHGCMPQARPAAGPCCVRRLRVVHALLSLDCGGMEHIVLDLVRLGIEAGQHVEVLCLERPGDLAPLVRQVGAPVHCMNKPPGVPLRLCWRIARLLRSMRPDVVHTHQIGTLFYTGPAARWCGVRAIVHTEHGQEYAHRRRTRWLGRLAARAAMRFFCVSDDTARHVIEHRIVPRRKVRVIHNGIDIDRFAEAARQRDIVRRELQIPAAAPVVGTVGRLAEVKRQDLLIHALAELRRSVPDARLLLVGDGPNRQQLTALAAGLGLNDAVCFAGYRADRERLLAAMDVFALSSDSEGTPLALLEAWAAGLPVVATAVGGLPELIDHGSTGLLVPRGDPASLSATLAGLLKDAPKRRALGAAGHQLVRTRFDRRTMARQYARQYAELLKWPIDSDAGLAASASHVLTVSSEAP